MLAQQSPAARRPLILILTAFLLLGLVTSSINPLFESPDEDLHFQYVRWLRQGYGLPPAQAAADLPMRQIAAQPPLYYLLGAAPIAPIDNDGARAAVWLPPIAWTGAAAVIVYNNAAGALNGTLGGVDPATAPATGVTQATGQSLLAKMANGPVTVLTQGNVASYGDSIFAMNTSTSPAPATNRFSGTK